MVSKDGTRMDYCFWKRAWLCLKKILELDPLIASWSELSKHEDYCLCEGFILGDVLIDSL